MKGEGPLWLFHVPEAKSVKENNSCILGRDIQKLPAQGWDEGEGCCRAASQTWVCVKITWGLLKCGCWFRRYEAGHECLHFWPDSKWCRKPHNTLGCSEMFLEAEQYIFGRKAERVWTKTHAWNPTFVAIHWPLQKGAWSLNYLCSPQFVSKANFCNE